MEDKFIPFPFKLSFSSSIFSLPIHFLTVNPALKVRRYVILERLRLPTRIHLHLHILEVIVPNNHRVIRELAQLEGGGPSNLELQPGR